MIDSLFVGSVDALNPTPEQVNVGDMLHNLSHIPRWCGAGPLSVLQHMAHVARILARGGADRTTILAGLVHDLHEYVTGDIPAPLLLCLMLDTGAELRRVTDTQRHIQTAIEQRLGVDLTGADMQTVDAADKQARDMEQGVMQGGVWPSWMEQIVDRDADAVVRLYRRGLEQLGVIL